MPQSCMRSLVAIGVFGEPEAGEQRVDSSNYSSHWIGRVSLKI